MLKKIIRYTSIAFVLFHIYTAIFGILPGINQRVVHLGFALVLCAFLDWSKHNENNQNSRTKKLCYDLLMLIYLAMAFVTTVYGLIYGNQILVAKAGIYTTTDYIFGIMTLVLLLEMTRRNLGWALPVLACLFLAYAKWGYLVPGYFSHRGYGLYRIVTQMYLGYEGIYGMAIASSATFIAMFIIFGGLLFAMRGTDVFSDMAFSMVGSVRGGPAKVAVVASSLFGTMSGSVTANVVGTGSFTIPLMKKTGYPAAFAGAIEATASCGGQIMPPVMGVAAFIMAEYLGVPYVEVLKSAIIPAILYFFGVFMAVDLHAAKIGLKGLPESELPRFGAVMKKGYFYLLPLVVVVCFLMTGASAMRSAFYASLACVVLGLFILKKQFVKEMLDSFVDTASQFIPVALGTATAGIIIGVFSLTGLGFKLSSALITLSGGNVLVLLVLTMIASLILGCGLPTVAAYILLATLIVPALTQMGIVPMAAHLFVLYYGVLSNITPPVCLGVFAASGIANAPMLETARNAIKIALPAFIIPYVFVSNPAMLMLGGGSIAHIIYSFLVVFFGVCGVSIGVFGYFVRPVSTFKRILFIVSGSCLVHTVIATDVIGIIVLIGVAASELIIKKKIDHVQAEQTVIKNR